VVQSHLPYPLCRLLPSQVHAPTPERLNSTRSCGINQMNYGSNAPGPGCRASRTTQGRPHHPGPAEPPGAAAPAQLGQTSHRASVNQGNIASNNPDRRSEVSSIQRTRLASLGFMNPQTSDQPTLGNDQHSTYIKEHAPECMTRGPRAGCTKGSGRTSLKHQADPQSPSNHLRDQITDAQSKVVKITGPTAPGHTAAPPCRLVQLPLAYKYPLLQPPTYWGYKLSQAPRGRSQVIRSK
jgi:hypothetical protein